MEVIALGWLVCAGIVAAAANARGRSGILWFLVALVISPLLALVLVLVLQDQRREEAHATAHATYLREQADSKTCPRCAETIRRAAKVCRHCGHAFSEEEELSHSVGSVEPTRGNYAKGKMLIRDYYKGVAYILHADGIVVAGLDGTPHTWPGINEFKAWADAQARRA